MEIDDMEEQSPKRRWEDVRREIEFFVPPAVNQALTPYRLDLDETRRKVQDLYLVVFGNPAQGIRGMVANMDEIRGKLSQLLDTQQQREEDWKEMRAFLVKEEERQAVQSALSRYVKRYGTIISLVAGLMTILAFLQIIGVIHLGA
jgi:hypothetical protein